MLSRLWTKLRLFFELKYKTLTTTPGSFTGKLKYNTLLTYLLLAIIFFVPTLFFVFTALQLFGIEYNCIKVLNLFNEFFANILKFLENNFNNFNNQETTMSFKNENSTSNNAMLDAKLTSNSKVDKGVDAVKELKLESKNTNTTTNSNTSDDTEKSYPLVWLKNKYVIATFIGGLVIGAVWLIYPDLPETCFRALKNLFWGNGGNDGNQGNIPDQPLQNVPQVDKWIYWGKYNNPVNRPVSASLEFMKKHFD